MFGGVSVCFGSFLCCLGLFGCRFGYVWRCSGRVPVSINIVPCPKRNYNIPPLSFSRKSCTISMAPSTASLSVVINVFSFAWLMT